MSVLGCVPIRFYSWTLDLELYIIFMCNKIPPWLLFSESHRAQAREWDDRKERLGKVTTVLSS